MRAAAAVTAVLATVTIVAIGTPSPPRRALGKPSDLVIAGIRSCPLIPAHPVEPKLQSSR